MKKIFRRILVVVVALGLLVAAMHFWLVNHAEQLISEVVRRESNGKVKLDLEKINYNYRTRQLRLKNAVLYNDPDDTLSAYRFQIPEIRLRLLSLRELIFQKKLGIDSITIASPVFEVTRNARRNRNKNISLSTEMGRVYNGITQTLQKLQIREMHLLNGKFVLKDNSSTPHTETVISNIDFQIDNLNISDSTSPERPFFAENIRFNTRNQHIDLPGGRQRLGFARFNINMKAQLISIDSFYIQSLRPEGEGNQLKAAFDSIRLIRIDFAALYNDETIVADSVYCSSPKLRLSLLPPSGEKKKLSLREVLNDIGTSMELRYVGLRNAEVQLKGGKQEKEITFKGDNRLIEMDGLHIDPDGASPLRVDRFVLEANNYESYSPDSVYQIKLSSIGLEDQTLRLENVAIKTHLQKPGQPFRDHNIPLLTLNGIDWQALLFDKKIVAEDVTLTDPTVFFRKTTPGSGPKISVFDALDVVNDLVTVKDIRVENGRFYFELPQQTRFEFTGVSGMVHGNQLLYASNSREMEQSVGQLHIRDASLRTGRWRLAMREADYRPDDAMLRGERLELFDADQQLQATANGFTVSSIVPVDSLQQLNVGSISWEKANIRYAAGPLKRRPDGDKRSGRSLFIASIAGKNTGVNFDLPNNARAGTAFRYLHLRDVRPMDAGFLQSGFPRLSMAGDSIYYADASTLFSGGAYTYTEKGTFSIAKPALVLRKPGVQLNMTMQSLETDAPLPAVTGNSIDLKHLNLYQPEVHLFLDSTTSTEENTEARSVKKSFSIGELTLHHPAVHVYKETGTGSMELHPQLTDIPKQWRFSGVKLDGQEDVFTIRSATFSDSLHLHLAGSKTPNYRFSTEVLLENISIPMRKNTEASVAVSRVSIPSISLPGADDLFLKGIEVRHPKLVLQKETSGFDMMRLPGWKIGVNEGLWSNGRDQLKWTGTQYISDSACISIDGFELKPLLSKDSFFLQQVFQTDYITASGGRSWLKNINRQPDSSWTADLLELNGTNIAAYRDKRLPFQHGSEKKMPTQMLEDAGIPIAIREINARDMKVTYGEWNDKTDKEGFVTLEVNKAQLFPVTTTPQAGDTLFLTAQGRFMEQIPFQVSIEQPYLDTLRQMQVYLLAGPGMLTGLNAMLPALGSVYIKSGRFSQLTMNASADKNTATGEMLLRYQNLHLRILKKGNMEKKGFFASIATFLADHLLVKHSNQYRKGVFKHQRNTEKSVFNYLVKIIIKGAGTSAGLLKNKKNKK